MCTLRVTDAQPPLIPMFKVEIKSTQLILLSRLKTTVRRGVTPNRRDNVRDYHRS